MSFPPLSGTVAPHVSGSVTHTVSSSATHPISVSDRLPVTGTLTTPIGGTTTLGSTYPWGSATPSCVSFQAESPDRDPSSNGSVAIQPLSDKTFQDLLKCCTGSPILGYNGCTGACYAFGQSAAALGQCFDSGALPEIQAYIMKADDPIVTQSPSTSSTTASAAHSATSSAAASVMRPIGGSGSGSGMAGVFVAGTLLFSFFGGAVLLL